MMINNFQSYYDAVLHNRLTHIASRVGFISFILFVQNTIVKEYRYDDVSD